METWHVVTNVRQDGGQINRRIDLPEGTKEWEAVERVAREAGYEDQDDMERHGYTVEAVYVE